MSAKKLKEVDLYKQQLQMYEQLPEQMKAVNGLSDEDYNREVARLRELIELSNRGKRSRRKGASYENVVAKKFGEVYDIKLVRTPLSGGFQKQSESTDFRGDLNCIEPHKEFKLHLECKNHKAWSVGAWWKQAVSDCPDNRIPALVMHRGQEIKEGKVVTKSDDFIMIRLDDFLHIVDGKNIIELKEEQYNESTTNQNVKGHSGGSAPRITSNGGIKAEANPPGTRRRIKRNSAAR